MCLYTVLFIFHYCGKETSSVRSTVLNNCDVYGLVLWDFSDGSGVNNTPANAGDVGSISCQEDPLEKEMQSTPIVLPGKSHGQRSLVAIHSNSLAWEISWTEKPGSLQSTGLQKSWAQISN